MKTLATEIAAIWPCHGGKETRAAHNRCSRLLAYGRRPNPATELSNTRTPNSYDA